MTYTIEQISDLSRCIVTLLADGKAAEAQRLTILLNAILENGTLLKD